MALGRVPCSLYWSLWAWPCLLFLHPVTHLSQRKGLLWAPSSPVEPGQGVLHSRHGFRAGSDEQGFQILNNPHVYIPTSVPRVPDGVLDAQVPCPHVYLSLWSCPSHQVPEPSLPQLPVSTPSLYRHRLESSLPSSHPFFSILLLPTSSPPAPALGSRDTGWHSRCCQSSVFKWEKTVTVNQLIFSVTSGVTNRLRRNFYITVRRRGRKGRKGKAGSVWKRLRYARLDTKLITSTGHKVAKFPCQTKIIFLFQQVSFTSYQFFFLISQFLTSEGSCSIHWK